MPVISIRVTNEEYAKIISDAANGYNSVSEYAHDILFPESIKSASPSELTQKEVINRIKNTRCKGDLVRIPELFTSEEWGSFSNTITVGRLFRIASKNPDSEVSKIVEFVDKKSGDSAIYRVL